jgi:hypothetical protein
MTIQSGQPAPDAIIPNPQFFEFYKAELGDPTAEFELWNWVNLIDFNFEGDQILASYGASIMAEFLRTIEEYARDFRIEHGREFDYENFVGFIRSAADHAIKFATLGGVAFQFYSGRELTEVADHTNWTVGELVEQGIISDFPPDEIPDWYAVVLTLGVGIVYKTIGWLIEQTQFQIQVHQTLNSL